MNLVIVESPTKAKTITKFLDDNYVVYSSYGHVRDLPKGELGVDTENNFKPKYVIPTTARKKITELKKQVTDADNIILATDEDREGEAIAWHLKEALNLANSKSKSRNTKSVERIVFHEITKSALLDALKNPRKIDMNLVNSQQARRILDRLVGYKLSPFLWKKVIRGLSAGRVQSVVIRLIVEKEREVQKFKPKEYYTIEATLRQIPNSEFQIPNAETFIAYLYSKNKKALDKLYIKNKKESDEVLNNLKTASWIVENIEQKDIKKNPFPPFTTSTLQQAAWGHFGYQAKRTMMLAQNLYERGLITYHRTDSLNIAESALAQSRTYIKTLGEKYLPDKPCFYKTKTKGAQEAHEAIRPTQIDKIPEKVGLEIPQKKLYELIWQRFVASQMTSAQFAATTVDISTQTPYAFRGTGYVKKFDGFMKIYPIKSEEKELPELKIKDELNLEKLETNQHFTKPPARYSEASLVKALEIHGIGRPSTYASIISTIQLRNYVLRNEQKRLAPTEIGFVVTDLLMEHFPEIMDIEFTAKMEHDLDEIAQGKIAWQKSIKEFYEPFTKKLEEKYENVEKTNMTEETDKKCPECNKNMLKRMGRFGWFYACSGFPECRHTETIKENGESAVLDVYCPKCQEGKVTEKRTRKGKIFYGCNKYPDCDFALWYKPYIKEEIGKSQIVHCPDCESVLIEKGKNIACSNKECKWKQPI